MKEETVPVTPLTTLALRAMMTHYLFRSNRIRGNRSSWGETPVNVQVFFEHFYRAINYSIFLVLLEGWFLQRVYDL
jgi:hypothetical protein